jgi:Gpi18-like mannosyltransferase
MRHKYFIALLAIIILAAGVRFAIAPQLSIEAREDVLLFQLWGYSINEHGLTNAYTAPVNHPWFVRIPLPNYLPPYMYVLGGVEWLRRHIDPGNNIGTPFASVLSKTVPILFELGTILLLAAVVRRRTGEKWAVVAAAVYAFLPPILFSTAGWGQVDAVNTFFMVLCVWQLQRRQFLWASIAFTVAFFVKMQSIVLLPLLFFELIRTKQLAVIFRSVLGALATMFVLNAPFLLAGKFADILQVLVTAPGSYPHPSANAFNFWWFFSGGHWLARTDTSHFLALTLAQWGAVLFIAAACFALWFRSRLRTDDSLWLTAAFLAFAFFMLPTEMHERYLFPFFALLIPVLPVLRRARWIFGALGVTFTWNLLAVFLIITHDRGATTTEQLLGHFWGGSLIVAALNVALLIATVVWYTQSARKRILV